MQHRVDLDGIPLDPAHHWNQGGVRVSPDGLIIGLDEDE